MFKIYNSLNVGTTRFQNQNVTDNGAASKTPKANLLMSVFVICCLFLTGFTASAQITVTNPGNTTPALNATYASLALAITDVNNRTAISGPVTITLSAAEEAVMVITIG